MRPINLLPPASFEKQQSRRMIVRMSMILVAYLALLVIVSIAWSGRVAAAHQALADQQATNAELESRLTALQPASDLSRRYDADAQMIETALAGDISWGRILNDLGRLIPDRVWLEGFHGATHEVTPEEPGVGTIQVTGVGFDLPDVSAWVRSIDSDRYPGVDGAWVSSATEATIGEAPVVRFVSQTVLTDAALSDRASRVVPKVGG